MESQSLLINQNLNPNQNQTHNTENTQNTQNTDNANTLSNQSQSGDSSGSDENVLNNDYGYGHVMLSEPCKRSIQSYIEDKISSLYTHITDFLDLTPAYLQNIESQHGSGAVQRTEVKSEEADGSKKTVESQESQDAERITESLINEKANASKTKRKKKNRNDIRMILVNTLKHETNGFVCDEMHVLNEQEFSEKFDKSQEFESSSSNPKPDPQPINYFNNMPVTTKETKETNNAEILVMDTELTQSSDAREEIQEKQGLKWLDMSGTFKYCHFNDHKIVFLPLSAKSKHNNENNDMYLILSLCDLSKKEINKYNTKLANIVNIESADDT